MFSATITLPPAAAPARRVRHGTGYPKMAPKQSATASAPLHARVASIGDAGVPNSPTASAACSCVNGSTACTSVHDSRSMPKNARLHNDARSVNLNAVRPQAVSVGTRDLLHGDALRAEGSAQIIDRFQALESGGAREDVDVHGAGFRPRMQNRVRLGEDEHAGEARAGKVVADPFDDRRPRAAQGPCKQVSDFVTAKSGAMATLCEVDGVEGRR